MTCRQASDAAWTSQGRWSEAGAFDGCRGAPALLAWAIPKNITVEPGKRGGKPCIRGMRITVSDVLEYLAGGMSEDDILRDFPCLTRDDICACLSFAAEHELS